MDSEKEEPNETRRNVFESNQQEMPTETNEDTQSRQKYTAWDHSSVAICADCGCLVLVTSIADHNDFHSSMMLHLPTRR